MTTVLRAGDHTEMPWRNGQGTTWEVLTAPAADSDGFAWRVSFARVDGDCDFSSFPGVDRVIVLVDGEGMQLTLGGRDAERLAPFRPFAFPGEAEVRCRTPSATLDLNVMVRRATHAAVVEVLELGATERPMPEVSEDADVLVVALGGRVTATGDRGAVTTLAPLDVLHGTPVGLVGPGRGAIVVLTRR